MQKNILVSIVIPCYDDAQYIVQAVNSALNQSYPYKEIIVVDDGSNLETKVVLQKLESKITKLITQNNLGQSTARNVGIKESIGDYILVLDSDDFFEPTFVEKAVLALEDSSIKIVACYITRLINANKIDEYHHKGGDISALLLNNQATGSVMFRKEDFSKVGGYDESMRKGFEDWEFYIRILQKGGLLHVIKEPLFNYRIRTDSTTSKANQMKFDLLNFVYLKHQELYKIHFASFIGHLLSKIEKEEGEKIKNTQRLEFKIGKAILKPLRWVKSLLR